MITPEYNPIIAADGLSAFADHLLERVAGFNEIDALHDVVSLPASGLEPPALLISIVSVQLAPLVKMNLYITLAVIPVMTPVLGFTTILLGLVG